MLISLQPGLERHLKFRKQGVNAISPYKPTKVGTRTPWGINSNISLEFQRQGIEDDLGGSTSFVFGYLWIRPDGSRYDGQFRHNKAHGIGRQGQLFILGLQILLLSGLHMSLSRTRPPVCAKVWTSKWRHVCWAVV